MALVEISKFMFRYRYSGNTFNEKNYFNTEYLCINLFIIQFIYFHQLKNNFTVSYRKLNASES